MRRRGGIEIPLSCLVPLRWKLTALAVALIAVGVTVTLGLAWLIDALVGR